MLKEMAPRVRRVAAMYNPDYAPQTKSFQGSFEAAAQVLGVALGIVPIYSDAEIETAIDALGREEGGLVSLTDSFMLGHREAIIAAAARNKVPTIYGQPGFANSGGSRLFQILPATLLPQCSLPPTSDYNGLRSFTER